MRSVLIIDNSLTVRMDLKEAFERAAWKATTCDSATAARASLAEDRFHVVIMDNWLSDGSGVEFLKELKSNRTTVCTPVILLSGQAEVSDQMTELGVRADGYAGKPYDLSDLLSQAQLLADCHWETASRPSVPLILTVDDSPTYAHELASQLSQDGLQVLVAESGKAALDLLEIQPVDCVLLDMMMPGMPGEEVCRRIKSLANSQAIPVIMLTGRDDQDALLESFEAGADDYVSKSSDFIILRARLRAQLHRRRVETETNRIREELHQKRTTELAEHAKQLRALAGELALTEQRERRRIAKVLHDHLQQLLFGAMLRVDVLRRAEDNVVKQAAVEVKELLSQSIDLSRSLTAELSPPILQEGGLAAGLKWLAGWMADKHGLHVELDLDHDISPLVEDVKILLFESVRELIFNAVKHARVHSVTVAVRQTEDSAIEITVSDQGPGFDPPKADAQAGGLGLFGIRERLELIGGRMQVDSSPGKGSRLTLTVPLAQPAIHTTESTLQAGFDKPDLEVSSRTPGSKIRVLLADDHAVVREGLSQLLSREPDIEIVGGATDGQVAVELAGTLLPDVILMDLSMPRLNGIEATRVIHQQYPDIRIIGLSMFEEGERAQAMRDAGASDYVTKAGPSVNLIGAIRASSQKVTRS